MLNFSRRPQTISTVASKITFDAYNQVIVSLWAGASLASKRQPASRTGGYDTEMSGNSLDQWLGQIKAADRDAARSGEQQRQYGTHAGNVAGRGRGYGCTHLLYRRLNN